MALVSSLPRPQPQVKRVPAPHRLLKGRVERICVEPRLRHRDTAAVKTESRASPRVTAQPPPAGVCVSVCQCVSVIRV